FFVLNVLGVTTTAFVLLQYFVREREREQVRSERLLLSVLPEPVATRLKRGEEPIADGHIEVTVLFADVVGFTPACRASPCGGSGRAAQPRLTGVWFPHTSHAATLGRDQVSTPCRCWSPAGDLPVWTL